MYRVKCAEVWGGTLDADMDVCTSGLTASLYSASSDSGRGGDIYYFSVCQHDVLTRVVVADVVGHGRAINKVSQWLYEALVRQIETPDSNAVLADLNRTATERGLEALTTAAVVTFYLDDYNLNFSYAGHPPLLMCRRSEIDWRVVNLPSSDAPQNLPLGVPFDAPYEQQRMRLAPGDKLFLYTDGVIESPGKEDDLFGIERLTKVLRETHGENLNEVKRSVLTAIRAYTGGSMAHDDVTMLAVEIN